MDKNNKDIYKKISESDPDRLNAYIDLFDRLILYNLVAATIPSNVINEMIDKWEETVKITINNEVQHRTHFLESTPQGRMAYKQQQPDGEEIRLLFLDTLKTAKQIVARNIQIDETDKNDTDFNEGAEF